MKSDELGVLRAELPLREPGPERRNAPEEQPGGPDDPPASHIGVRRARPAEPPNTRAANQGMSAAAAKRTPKGVKPETTRSPAQLMGLAKARAAREAKKAAQDAGAAGETVEAPTRATKENAAVDAPPAGGRACTRSSRSR